MENKILNILEKIDARLDKLEAGQSKLVEGYGKLEDSQSKLVEKYGKLEAGQLNIEKDIKIIKDKLDATFERTGKNFEEITKIQSQLENLEIIKEDIAIIKHSLRSKADLEELVALENRVSLIERRLLKLSHNE